MPRPKRKTAAQAFGLRPHTLPLYAVSELGKLLNSPLNEGDQQSVGIALAVAIDARPHLDKIPRPIDYVREFTRIRRQASRLRRELESWSDYYRSQFSRFEVNLARVESSLMQVEDVANNVISDNIKGSSAGAGPENARKEAVRLLSELFREKYRGPSRGLAKRESEFILTALVAGKAVPMTYSGLPSLLRRLKREE